MEGGLHALTASPLEHTLGLCVALLPLFALVMLVFIAFLRLGVGTVDAPLSPPQ